MLIKTVLKNRLRDLVFFAAVLLVITTFLHAQQPETLTLTAEDFAGGKSVSLDKLRWKYRADDDPAFAEKDFDDQDWKSVTNDQINKDVAATLENWNGRAWFRLHLHVEESLVGKPLAYGIGERRKFI